MRAWTVLVVLSILLMSSAFPVFNASAQEPVRSLSMLELQCTTPNVTVLPTQTVTSSFETTVEVFDTIDENGTVFLNASNDMDWPTTVIPPSFEFTKPLSKKVNITVTVPAGTDASLIAVVKLYGTAQFPGEDATASIFGYLKLNRTFGIELNYSYLKRSREETRIQLEVLNRGNAQDHLVIVLLDGEELDRAQISVLLSNHGIEATPNNWYSVILEIKYDGSRSQEKFDLRVQVISEEAPQRGLWVNKTLIIPLTFKGPEPPIQPLVFSGLMVAVVIIAVVAMAVALRVTSRKSK